MGVDRWLQTPVAPYDSQLQPLDFLPHQQRAKPHQLTTVRRNKSKNMQIQRGTTNA